jgi:hypothetical protein
LHVSTDKVLRCFDAEQMWFGFDKLITSK